MASDLEKLALFPLISGGMALYSGIRGFREYNRAKVSRHWPSVEGTVIASQVERIVRQTRNGVSITWRPRIRYGYAIGHHQLEGERIYFGAEDAQFWTNRTASDLVQHYPPGAKCLVFVDPARPGEAVLQRGVMSHASSMLLMCFGTAVITLIFLFMLFLY